MKVLLLLLSVVCGCKGGNLVEEIEKAGATTLLSLLKSTGLDATLTSGYYSVFVPTNAAFAALPEELQSVVRDNVTLTSRILQYHVVPAIFRVADSFNDLELQAASGHNVRVNVYRDGDKTPVVTAEGRRVIGPDIQATNGYLHLVDGVLLPPSGDLYHLIETSAELSTLKSLIDAVAGLKNELAVHEGTLLAPTNEAFEGLVASLGQSAFDDIKANAVVLKEILLYHMVQGVIYGPGAFNGTYSSQDSATKLMVSTGADGVTYINHARVVLGDVPATNGVMHVIDQVLIPPKYVTGMIGK